MKFSIVIPTYNCARYLPQAIDSVLAQTFPVMEILVVDDGSTDGTEGMIRARYGAPVRYVRQANAGPSAARNRGILEARGEVIAFLDADDVWFPQALAQVAQCLDRHPRVGLVTADKEVIDTEGRTMEASWWTKQKQAEALYGLQGRPIEDAVARLLETNFINTSLAFVRTGILQEVGLFDENIRFGEDLELWLRIASRHPIVCLPEVLGQYRQHDSNMTRATERMLKDFVEVNRKVASWPPQRLRAASVDPDRLLADALCNLGYWYLCSGRYQEARHCLWKSLAAKINSRATKYALATVLPDALLHRLQDYLRGRQALHP